MKKGVKIGGIIIGFIAICYLGRFFYMVACISCTYPPIKIYEYNGDIEQLNSSLQGFISNHPETSFKFSRRDSSAEDDNGNRDLEIKIINKADTLSYGFDCKANENNVNIEMTAAFKNTRYGGYSAGAPGVQALVDSFENNVVARLKKEQYVVLKSD